VGKIEAILANLTPYRTRPDLFPGCLLAVEGMHVILFRVKNSTLQVVRVLHGAMDFPRHLEPSS
jgi:plasmid stabilization system protein ParE